MKPQFPTTIVSAASPARTNPPLLARPTEFAPSAEIAQTKTITLCHFSTIHTDLKSRSFHRACLPLAAAGIAVRYVSPLKFHGRRDGVDFLAIPVQGKRLERLLAAPSLLKMLLAQAADIYHFQDTELLPLAFALKLLFRKRVIYDAYEDFPSIARAHASIPRFLRPLAAQLMAATEHLAAQCFDGITTADPFTLRRLARTGRSRKIVFHNFPNSDFFPSPSSRAKPFDVVYRGGLSERAGTFVLLDAMRLLADRGQPARLSLIGYHDSPAAELELLERIRILGLESTVTLTGKIAHEDMAAALSSASIGVSPLQDTPKFRLNIPVKVFEYWACGLPVIASDLPSIRPYFKNARAGLLFPPGDAPSLAQSIAWMLEHPAPASRMGMRGRSVILQRFNNRNEVHKLLDLCFRIAASGR
jgi:glycosyltransferase involved in cell wall biosynthesis